MQLNPVLIQTYCFHSQNLIDLNVICSRQMKQIKSEYVSLSSFYDMRVNERKRNFITTDYITI